MGPGAVGLTNDVEERHLADHCRDPPVDSARGQRVSATHRGPERHDPRRVCTWPSPSEVDRGRPVFELPRRLEQVRGSVAVAESTVVENHCKTTMLSKAFGECAKPIATCPRQSVGHHDDRAGAVARHVAWLIQPRGASIVHHAEPHVISRHTR
jgi:hypothetical protein